MDRLRQLAFTALLVLPSNAGAETSYVDTYGLASNVADLLVAEEPCGLSYDQAGIAAFIENEVAADNLDFSGLVKLKMRSAAHDFEEFSASQKTVQCTQAKRVAKSYGFLK